jgi:hypothetical protein
VSLIPEFLVIIAIMQMDRCELIIPGTDLLRHMNNQSADLDLQTPSYMSEYLGNNNTRSLGELGFSLFSLQ